MSRSINFCVDKMALTLAVCMVTCQSAATSSPTQSREEIRVRKTIQSAYDRSDRAASHLDATGMADACGPECVFVTPDGSVVSGVGNVRDDIKMMLQVGGVTKLNARTEINQIELTGNRAVVDVHIHQLVRSVDPWLHVPQLDVNDYKCQDTWERTAAGWKLIRAQGESASTFKYGFGKQKTPDYFRW